MLLWFVIFYLMVSVGIGLFAATRVHNAKDFAVAGRSLPLPIVTATVFATWFGAEAVFGVSATFVKEGLGGVVADPFGAALEKAKITAAARAPFVVFRQTDV